jgi:hypothetical protein
MTTSPNPLRQNKLRKASNSFSDNRTAKASLYV